MFIGTSGKPGLWSSLSRTISSLGQSLSRQSYAHRIEHLATAGPHKVSLEFNFTKEATTGRLLLDGRALTLVHCDRAVDWDFLDGLLWKYMTGYQYKRPPYQAVMEAVARQDEKKPLRFGRVGGKGTKYRLDYRYDCGPADTAYSLEIDAKRMIVKMTSRTIGTCWEQ